MQRERELEEEAFQRDGLQQAAGEDERREMITPALREALTKQGDGPSAELQGKVANKSRGQGSWLPAVD